MTAGFAGRAIEVRYESGLRDTAGNPAHAATFIRRRLIVLDGELRSRPREHARILAHELFHFVWVRLGNAARRGWERELAREIAGRIEGEAGWSAEWRKCRLATHDVLFRTRAWREYCCESFCDTGAVWATGLRGESTLPRRRLRARMAWLGGRFGAGGLPV